MALYFYIALGGAIGAMLRHGTSSFITRSLATAFPLGTLTVNIIGSLLMGLIVGYLVKTLPHSIELRGFLVVGLLGGFTTFSAFSLDVITLIERGAFWQATAYVVVSVVLSVLAVLAGLLIFRGA